MTSVLARSCRYGLSALSGSQSLRRKFSSSGARASVMVWGRGEEGQLGVGPGEKSGLSRSYEELLPVAIPEFDGVDVKSIALGNTHSAAVTADGTLYTWGDNKYGKLGNGKSEGIVHHPEPVEALRGVKIVEIDCGEHHTAAVSDDGLLYTWGWGGSFLSGVGGLGHGDTESHSEPRVVQILDEEHNVHVAKVQCGEKHSLALTKENEVWIWGCGDYGLLGDATNTSMKTPEPMEFFADVNVKQIAAGHAFSMALTEDGAVFTWGRNDQGQLGLGGSLSLDVYSVEVYPRLVEDLAGEEVAHIAAGYGHAVAVTTDGKLFVWGSKIYLAPHEMSEAHNIRIKDAACGKDFTVAITDTGAVYTFSKGRNGCLGLEDRKGRRQPTAVPALASYRAQRVACGQRHAAVIIPNTASDQDFSMRH